MKKYILSMAMILLLSGCNITIPIPNPNPNPNPTPDPTPTPTNNVPTLPNNPALLKPQLRGYGAVNEWLKFSDSTLKAMVDCIATSGCNMVSIELFGREEEQWINHLDTVKAKFSVLMAEAKAKNVIVFIDMVNWGDTSIVTQSDSWFQGWLDYLKGFGNTHMVVQVGGEASGDQATRWYTMAENTLSGFILSYNIGARPSTASSKYTYIDYHSASIGDNGSSDKRIMCDTDSGILNSIMNGGVLGQTFITADITSFATTPLKDGKSVNLYGYYHNAPDYNAINTLGKIK